MGSDDWRSEPFNPDWCSAPGDTIFDCLDERGMSVEMLVEAMREDRDTIALLLIGEYTLDDDLAGKLSDVLGASKQFWLNREAQYREGLAKGLKKI
jgi:HTH-type transcriptional regulator / antitoxin HigA